MAATQFLDLSGNQLTSLPAEVGQLAGLTMLSLSNNQLTSLPAKMGQLAGLKWLLLDEHGAFQAPPTRLRGNWLRPHLRPHSAEAKALRAGGATRLTRS